MLFAKPPFNSGAAAIGSRAMHYDFSIIFEFGVVQVADTLAREGLGGAIWKNAFRHRCVLPAIAAFHYRIRAAIKFFALASRTMLNAQPPLRSRWWGSLQRCMAFC